MIPKKRKVCVIDDDSDEKDRKFMVNAINEHSFGMHDDIDVPIICLDDEDDNGARDLKIDRDYKVFLDDLSSSNGILGPLFEVNNGKSDIRKFDESKPVDRLYQGMKRKFFGIQTENLRDVTLAHIQRDNRAAERRKRRLVGLETTRTSRAVPLRKTQRDNRVGKLSELKAETPSRDETLSRSVPLVRSQEDIERDNIAVEQRKLRIEELKAIRTSISVPSVRTQEDIERGNIAVEQRKRSNIELEAERTSRPVPLVRIEDDIEIDNIAVEQRKRRIVELEATRTSRTVTSVRTQKDTERDNLAAERINSASNDAEICTVTHVERVNRATVVVDNEYKRYLEWLVDSLKESISKPMANAPDPDAIKESKILLDEDQLVEVKVERDVESWSDDSDIIAVSDSPFMDGDDALFVTSKKVVDLDGGSKEVESSSRCRFRKELMDVLEKPYNEGELRQLHHDVSIHRKMTRSRELRKGRETDYETNVLGKSYLEKFTDFEKEYKAVDGVDKVRALKLLRGFFFYLKHVCYDGSFKPWVKDQWWQPEGDGQAFG